MIAVMVLLAMITEKGFAAHRLSAAQHNIPESPEMKRRHFKAILFQIGLGIKSEDVSQLHHNKSFIR